MTWTNRRPSAAHSHRKLWLAFGWLVAAPAVTACADPVTEPTVTVEVAMRGAGAETMVRQVVAPLENYLGAVDGVAMILSISRAEHARLTLKFYPNRSVDRAIADVRLGLARARAQLPPDLPEATVTRIEPDAQPVAHIGFSSEVLPLSTLTATVEQIAKDRLQEVVGVADIRISGARREEMRIRIDGQRLTAYGVTLAQVEAGLGAARIEFRAVGTDSANPEFALSNRGNRAPPELLQEIVVGTRDGAPIRLRDIAVIAMGVEDDGIVARFNRRPAVVYEILRRPGADLAEVSRGVRDRLPAVVPNLPAGVRATIVYSCDACVKPPAR